MSIKYQHPFLRYEIAAHNLIQGGVLLIIAFIFQQNLFVRMGQLAIFMMLAKFAGKKISYLYFVVFCSGIVLAHLFVPLGRVLWYIGPFPITEGALFLGIRKASYILGFIFASLFMVRSDLQLPGKFGHIVAQTLQYYDAFLDLRRELGGGISMSSVSRMLLGVYETELRAPAPVAAFHTTKRGWLFLSVLVVLFWGSLLLPWHETFIWDTLP